MKTSRIWQGAFIISVGIFSFISFGVHLQTDVIFAVIAGLLGILCMTLGIAAIVIEMKK